jgi:hypothetical protein
MSKILYMALVCAVTITACKKDEEVNTTTAPVTPSTKTPKELLTASKWKITALVSSSLGDVWNNALFVKPCNQDNTYSFKQSDTLVAFDTPNKCNTTDPDSTKGPYKMMNGNTQIYLELLLGNINIKDTTNIQQLDEQTMILNVDYSGIPAVITFKH